MIHLNEKSIINNRAHFIDERRNEFNRNGQWVYESFRTYFACLCGWLMRAHIKNELRRALPAYQQADLLSAWGWSRRDCTRQSNINNQIIVCNFHSTMHICTYITIYNTRTRGDLNQIGLDGAIIFFCQIDSNNIHQRFETTSSFTRALTIHTMTELPPWTGSL